MHIAFLTPEYPGFKTGISGGLGTSIHNLALALTQQGLKISVFVYGQSIDENYIGDGIQYYRIRNTKRKGLSWWLTRKKIERAIHTVHQQDPIDIMEVPDWTGFSAWINFPCKVVMRMHGSDTYFCHLDKRPVKWKNYLQERIAFKQADALIAVSDFVGRQSNAVFGLNRDFYVIPNGIDSNRFSTVTNTSKEKIILYFGTLIRKKGALDIPLIFNLVIKRMPDAKLVLVGSDAKDVITNSTSTWGMMQQLFSSEAIHQSTYLGKKPYTEMEAYIQKASVCIFPSYAEGLPVSWLEAMAMGKAIVASNIGWACEMMEHEKEALLCHPSHHEAFASNILLQLSDSSLRQTLGENARRRVEAQFDNKIVAKQNIEFYSNILSEPR